MTQLEYLKASIEDGDSIVYACEQVDLDEMRAWIGDNKICFESEFEVVEELAAIELLTSRGYTITRN